jgi:Flp pilus assembly protein TadD
VHRGIGLSQLGQHKAALDVVRKVQQDRPDLPGIEPALARVLERAGSLKDAESTLVKALGRASSTELLEALSSFYARQKRLADAISLLSGAVARSPQDDSIQFALAALQEKKGDWQKAVDRLMPVIERHPDNAAALNFIGYTLVNNGGDLDEAERYVRRALELRPDSPAFLDSLGWIQFKRGRHEEAADTLELEGQPQGTRAGMLHARTAIARREPRRRRTPDAEERPRASIETAVAQLNCG